MPRIPIVDAHEDLAYNASILGRDYSRSVVETRRLERGSSFIRERDNSMLGWPEYLIGNVRLVFSTLFVMPAAHANDITRKACYRDSDEARRLCLDQIAHYQSLVETHPDKFTLIRGTADLDGLLKAGQGPEDTPMPPVGLVLLMEGAESIQDPVELGDWWSRGLRMIGPAWQGNRYCGGTDEPGPLTRIGKELLKEMAAFNFVLDLSHMDEEAVLDSLDFYTGSVMASHSNAAALLPGYSGNRHLSKAVIRGLIERNGVIGVVPCNEFLLAGWRKNDGKQGVGLGHLIDHIDYICQLAGNAFHVGIGTDFDGGFGYESAPAEMDSIADLQKLAPMLAFRGYSTAEIEAVLGGNFIGLLKRSLPS